MAAALPLLAAGCGRSDDGLGDAPTFDDPVATGHVVAVPAGVSAVETDPAGGTLVACEGGLAVRRSLEDLSEVTGGEALCPAGVLRATAGGRTVTAEGPEGVTWPDGSLFPLGPAYDVAFADEAGRYLLTAGWDAVRLWDLEDEAQRPLASERPGVGAVTGLAEAGAGTVVAYGAEGLALVTVDPEARAPDAVPSVPWLDVPVDPDHGMGAGTYIVENRGGEDLWIVRAKTEGARLSVEVNALLVGAAEPPRGVLAVVPPGEAALVQVSVQGGGRGRVDGAVLLVTNDPDEREVRTPVVAGRAALAAGDRAPDFALPDLEGTVYRLSRLAGSVVHVKFFSALCVACSTALPGLEREVWTPLRLAGLVPLTIHVGVRSNYALSVRDGTELSAPVLLDLDGSVHAAWSQMPRGHPPFPLGVLIDKEGVVRRVEVTDPPHEDWRAWIEEVLDE